MLCSLSLFLRIRCASVIHSSTLTKRLSSVFLHEHHQKNSFLGSSFRSRLSLSSSRLLRIVCIVTVKSPQMGTQMLSQVNGFVCNSSPFAAKSDVLSVQYPLNSLAIPCTTNFVSKPVSLKAFISRFQPILRNRKSVVIRAQADEQPGSEDDSDLEDRNSSSESSSIATLEVPDPGDEATKRKSRIKLGEIMGILNKRAIEASEKERPIPEIRTGDILQIKLEVPENRRRASIYKGIVISRQNAGIHTTIRIRRIIAGVGVEIVFPLYSPNIKEIKVVNHRKVRRARLYYLRDKLPRLSTFK